MNMMKFKPKSGTFILFIFCLFFFGLIASIVCMNFIVMNKFVGDLIEWVSFIFSIIAIIYISYLILRVSKRKIILYEDRIFVLEDVGSKDVKLQYELEIFFSDIQEILIKVDTRNSLNKSMRYVHTPMPYIVFVLSNGLEKRVNVYYYSKNQVIEVIDYIIKKKKVLSSIFSNKSGRELIENIENK